VRRDCVFAAALTSFICSIFQDLAIQRLVYRDIKGDNIGFDVRGE
jgi:hypothetical protein